MARENQDQFAREIGGASDVVAGELDWQLIAVDDAEGEAQSDAVLAASALSRLIGPFVKD